MYKALSPFQSHLYLEQVTSPCNKAESAYGAGWHRGQTANFLHSARTEARRYFSAYQNKAIRHARSAPYFKFWHRGKTATTQRVTSPCTRFIYCNAPTFHFTLLIKVSGVRISDGSPKISPTATSLVTAGLFHFLRALSNGLNTSKLTTVLDGIKCTYFFTISSEVWPRIDCKL